MEKIVSSGNRDCTVILDGTECSVKFDRCFRAFSVQNNSTSDVFVSVHQGANAGDDGVMRIKSGASACYPHMRTDVDTVYLNGTGEIQVHGQNTDNNSFRNAPVTGGGGSVPVYNENILINPDFKINQRNISGTFSETGKYFVDRWKLVSGTVTVNSGGTLTLNGTICQPLENAAGDNVTASVSAGAAVYDNAAKTFTVTGNGDTILWAKLENGNAATPFVQPDAATEFLKCCRYFQMIDPGSPTFGIVTNSNTLRMAFDVISPMRKNPTVTLMQHTGDFTWSFAAKNATGSSNMVISDFSQMSAKFIRTDGSMINVYLNVANSFTSGEMISTSGSGGIYYFLDAEIY